MKDYAQVKILQQQVKAAWAKLPADLKARLEPQIRAAHEYALALRNRAIAPTTIPPIPHQLFMVYSLLHDDPDGLLKSATQPAAEISFPLIAPDGEIFFGGFTYDCTDPWWAYMFVAMAETRHVTPVFSLPPKYPQQPAIPISSNASLAILGDWGGANQPAEKVGAAAKGDIFIHLGDVYYAGTNAGEFLYPYESTNFIDAWHGPVGQSFGLNSNHDMYARATGYALALQSNAFSAQQGANVFALSNDSFRVVGLDSAFYATDDMYDVGTLGSPTGPQAMFLQQQAELAAAAGQHLIIMTHHNGLSFDGSTAEPLWLEVANQLSSLSGKSVCWYWGHVHMGAVYAPQKVNGVTIYPRCCGHGCIPWGIADGLNKKSVLWFEQEVVGPGKKYLVTNGYATLNLTSGSMTETLYDQSGKLRWTDTWPSAAKAA
jgi:hypothetical protein